MNRPLSSEQPALPVTPQIHVPKEYRKNDYEIAVRQLFEDTEVGRVTFRLTSKKRKRGRFEVYQDKAGEYRWKLLAGNNEIIADSGQGYKQKKDCIQGIELVKAAGTDLRIILKKTNMHTGGF